MKKLSVLISGLLLLLLLVVACGPAAPAATDTNSEADTMSESADTDNNSDEAMVDDSEMAEEADASETMEESEPAAEVAEEDDSAELAPVGDIIDGAVAQPPTEALLAKLPPYDDSDIQTTASGLQYVIFEEGTGETAIPGDDVTAHYTGYFPDGNTFDSSVERGQPFNFIIGQGQVIPGWDEGFALLPVGTKALLIIPGNLAYGPSGRGDIPPNGTLYFDVEMIDVAKPEQPEALDDSDYREVDLGVLVADLQSGAGPEAEAGEIMSIHFAYWDGAGAFLGNTRDQGTPLSFPVGTNSFIPGIEAATEGMTVGAVRQAIIPGAAMEGTPLQGEDTFTFKIEMVSVSEGPPQSYEPANEGSFVDTETGVRYAELVEGDGVELVEGQPIEVVYHVWYEGGELLDSSLYTGGPVPYSFGQEGFPGWREGMAGMTAGGKRQLTVPAEVVGNPNITQTLVIELEVMPTVSP